MDGWHVAGAMPREAARALARPRPQAATAAWHGMASGACGAWPASLPAGQPPGSGPGPARREAARHEQPCRARHAQRRLLAPADRAFLHRVLGLATADHRYQPLMSVPGQREIVAALGDGTRPQARDLTARERAGLARLAGIIVSDLLRPPRVPPRRLRPA